MAKVIHKFALSPDSAQIPWHDGAKILTVQSQYGGGMLWLLYDPDESLTTRYAHVFGTGHQLPAEIDNMEYVATFQQRDGALVWHVFVE